MRRRGLASALCSGLACCSRLGFRFIKAAFIAVLIVGFLFIQQVIPPAGGQQLNAAPMNPPPANSQAVANSGLLPIYGVELNVDKAWIDASLPSQSTDFPNAGVNASFQQVWDALKPAGFNFVRVGVDVYDSPGSANRAANVCNWAQRNNVKVVLVLRGTGSHDNGDYASSATTFIKALAGLLKQDSYKASYAQIAAFELAPGLNNPSSLQQVSTNAKALDLLTQTAQSVRSGETDALKGSGIDATPLIVSASFDYELISAKAIVGTTLTDEAYNAAYSSLLQWLKPLAASPNLDLIAVDWFPGGISAGGVDKPPALLRGLANDIPGKQFLFTTGFSTAFHSEDEEKRFYTMTFANLGDLRASGGPSSPFVGVIYRGALNSKPPTAPDPSLPQAVAKWDWPSKAGELASMWTDQKKSDEMNWWLESVWNSMGLLHAQSDAFAASALQPTAGMLTLGQISSAVTASASSPAVQTGAAANGATASGQPVSDATAGQGLTTGATPGAGQGASGGLASTVSQNLQAKATQGLSGLLDNVMQRLTTMAQSGINSIGQRNSAFGNSGFGNPGFGSGNGLGQSPPPSFPQILPQTGGMNMPSGNMPSASPTGVMDMPSTPQTGAMDMASANVPSATTPADSGAMVAAMPGATAVTLSNMGAMTPMGLAPGSIKLAKQDITFQPANPTVGQPVQITANLHNQNASDAMGLTILASGARNAVLAEADSVQIPASSTYAATLQWTPSQAVSTPITLKVSDGTGMEIASIALDPVNVAPAAPASRVRAPIGSSIAGASGSITGPTSVADSTGATTLAPLGFAKIGDLAAENLVAGVPGSILVPISDPLLVPLTNIKAVLMVDGKTVQTQSVSTLLPQQSRSIVFSNLVIAEPGAHQARVGVQLMRAGKSQLGTVAQTIFVQPTPKPGVANAMPAGATSLRGAQSSTAHLRALTPAVAAPNTTTAANEIPGTRGAGTPAGAAASANQRAQLTLRPGDLSYKPSPATPGQQVAFSVLVRNSGSASVQQGELVLGLYADGKLVAASQPPIRFSVGANASYRANWQAAMPAGRQVQFTATVTGGGTPVSASGKASIVLESATRTMPKGSNPTKVGTGKHP